MDQSDYDVPILKSYKRLAVEVCGKYSITRLKQTGKVDHVVAKVICSYSIQPERPAESQWKRIVSVGSFSVALFSDRSFPPIHL